MQRTWLKPSSQFAKGNLISGSCMTSTFPLRRKSILLGRRYTVLMASNSATLQNSRWTLIPDKDTVHFQVRRVSSLSIVPFTWILVCMAKTQYSFSHDPKLKNVPTGKFFSLSLSSLLYQLQFFHRIQTTHKSSPTIGGRWLPVPYSWGYANHARTRHTAR